MDTAQSVSERHCSRQTGEFTNNVIFRRTEVKRAQCEQYAPKLSNNYAH